MGIDGTDAVNTSFSDTFFRTLQNTNYNAAIIKIIRVRYQSKKGITEKLKE